MVVAAVNPFQEPKQTTVRVWNLGAKALLPLTGVLEPSGHPGMEFSGSATKGKSHQQPLLIYLPAIVLCSMKTTTYRGLIGTAIGLFEGGKN